LLLIHTDYAGSGQFKTSDHSKDSFVSIEKAQQMLDYHPQFSNQDAMLRNYRWYKQDKDRLVGGNGVTHRLPWKQKALKLVKVFFNKSISAIENQTKFSIHFCLPFEDLFNGKTICNLKIIAHGNFLI
jgi:hypothetical protein